MKKAPCYTKKQTNNDRNERIIELKNHHYGTTWGRGYLHSANTIQHKLVSRNRES